MHGDCILCNIVKGKIPSYKIYENKDFLAFLDTQPVNKGHTLIIPKKHYENLFDVPEDILAKMAIFTQKVSKAIIKAVNAKGFNIGINNGKVAGQAIHHIHIHIMPRFKGDGYKLWPGKKPDYDLEELAQKIKNSL